MKCEECNHQGICWIYREHILKLQNEGVEITINKCKEFDEVKEIIADTYKRSD